jgi:hypothetical protein
VAAFASLGARPARAQDTAAAEVLYERGMSEWKAGRVEAGCKAIAESQRLDPRPGTLFTLATCEAEASHLATAWARFGEYLSLYDRLAPDVQARQGDRPKVARAQRDKLSSIMPQLTLALPAGVPPGTVVKRNGVVMSEASLGIPLPVDPGTYVITIEAPGAPAREERITIASGERKTVMLTVTAPTPPPAPLAPAVAPLPPPPGAPPPAHGTSGRRVGAFVTGAIGIAGLVVGGATGGVVLSRKSTLNAHCGAAIHSSDPGACDATGLSAASGLTGLGIASTVGFAVGIAGIGTSIVLFATEPKSPPATAGERPGLAFGLLSVGPGATTLGAHGAF